MSSEQILTLSNLGIGHGIVHKAALPGLDADIRHGNFGSAFEIAVTSGGHTDH